MQASASRGLSAAAAPWVLALVLLAPLAVADDAAVSASIDINQTALTATLYNAQSDVRVALSGTVHIHSERGNWVQLALSIEGTSWSSSVSPSTISRQTDGDVPFTGWVDVPRTSGNGTFALAVHGVDKTSPLPIDTQASFTVSVFRGPLAVDAALSSPTPHPGETARWNLTLRNLATFDLDFDLAFNVPSGFRWSATPPPVQLIAAGASASVLLDITPSATTSAGDYEWSVGVTSSSHPEVSASLAAPFEVAEALAPAPSAGSDLIATYWLPITFGLFAAGVAVFFSVTEVGYLALAFSFLVPLFTRLKREKVLDNFTRGQIYGYIQANPGAHYSAIQQVLDIENGVLAYHLRVLLRENYLVARNEGVFKRFYPRDQRLPKRRALLTRLQVDILEHTDKNPGISQRDLARALGESKQVISYNVGVLRDGGLLSAERVGRDVVLRTLEEGARTLAQSEVDDLGAGQGPSDLAPL